MLAEPLHSSAYARVVVAGCYRDPLGLASGGLLDALAERADVIHLPVTAPMRQWLAAYAAASRAIVRDGAELVHILDARFARLGRSLRQRYGVPFTMTLTARDLRGRAAPDARTLAQADHVFTTETAVRRRLAEIAPSAPLTVTAPAVRPLPWPSKRAMDRVTRAVRNVEAGRLIVALPWPDERGELRIFRDYVLPQLEPRPACLFLGAPGRNEARILFGPELLRQDVRIIGGRVDADLIAAVSRCVDAFLVLSGCDGGPVEDANDLAVALTMGGAPVVTAGAEDARVLAHERSAFVVERDDHEALIRTTNRLLALPAVQRHALGETFARHTYSSGGGWDAVAEVYAERFASLVGRPRIPAEWLAAA